MKNKRNNKWIGGLLLLGIVNFLVILPQSCSYIKDKDVKEHTTPVKEVVKENSELQGADAESVISFKDEQGNIYNIDELKGKVLFINFWATWCPPCKAEMPSIQILYDKFKDNQHVRFLLVEIENDIEGVHKFLKQEHLTLPIVYPNSNIPEAWLSGAIPTTVILDKEGKLASREQGMRDYSAQSVEDFMQNLINQ